MKKYMLFAFALVCFATINAQEVKFGDIPKEALEEKQHPKDPEADAAVLYEKIYLTTRYVEGQGFQLETNVHKRIKIYNKDGFEHANHYIPLYKGSGEREKVSGLKGYTYNLENGKIEDTKKWCVTV